MLKLKRSLFYTGVTLFAAIKVLPFNRLAFHMRKPDTMNVWLMVSCCAVFRYGKLSQIGFYFLSPAEIGVVHNFIYIMCGEAQAVIVTRYLTWSILLTHVTRCLSVTCTCKQLSWSTIATQLSRVIEFRYMYTSPSPLSIHGTKHDLLVR